MQTSNFCGSPPYLPSSTPCNHPLPSELCQSFTWSPPPFPPSTGCHKCMAPNHNWFLKFFKNYLSPRSCYYWTQIFWQTWARFACSHIDMSPLLYTASAMPLVNLGYPFSFFYFHSGLRNCDDKRHLFVLHYIFFPRINRVLKSFVKSWNKHPIRTENNWSPEQIWTNGMIDLGNCQYQHISEIHDFEIDGYDDWTWYGMDWYVPSPADDGLSTVTVEDVPLITNDLQPLYAVKLLDRFVLESS